MDWKAATIQYVARLAAASPGLRVFLLALLNRTPGVKRHLKRALARANTLAAQEPGAHAERDAEDSFLSLEARRALRDLLRARADAERDAGNRA